MTPERIRTWEARFPELKHPWTHWQIDGDDRVLGVFAAQELAPALRRVKDHWAHCAYIHCQPARKGDDGAVMLQPSRRLIVDHAEETALAVQRAAEDAQAQQQNIEQSRRWWMRAFLWLTESPYAKAPESNAPPPPPDPLPEGNISPRGHKNLNDLLLILGGVLGVLLLWLVQRVEAPLALEIRLSLGLMVALLAILAIWWLRPRLMRTVWRARCPACGKTMDYGQQPWPVAEGHYGPDFEQGVYYLEYGCRACGATQSFSLLKRWFPYYHQVVNFTVGLILFLFFCEIAIYYALTGKLG